MADQRNLTKVQLLAEIDNAWVMFNSFLDNLSTAQKTTIHDDRGWSVKDHITHITAWEEMVVFFLQGKPRHEARGVSEAIFETGPIDQVNELVREERKHLRLSEANAQMQAVHRQMVNLVNGLTEEYLNKALDETRPGEDARRVIDLIRDNSSGHFAEHLDWIETLAQRPV